MPTFHTTVNVTGNGICSTKSQTFHEDNGNKGRRGRVYDVRLAPEPVESQGVSPESSGGTLR